MILVISFLGVTSKNILRKIGMFSLLKACFVELLANYAIPTSIL
jgi:hypothetical protein